MKDRLAKLVGQVVNVWSHDESMWIQGKLGILGDPKCDRWVVRGNDCISLFNSNQVARIENFSIVLAPLKKGLENITGKKVIIQSHCGKMTVCGVLVKNGSAKNGEDLWLVTNRDGECSATFNTSEVSGVVDNMVILL